MDGKRVGEVLDGMHKQDPITCLIHGAAAGADHLAYLWSQLAHVPEASFPAQWTMFGRSAGPLRNSQMLHEGKPDVVVAFPGGRGTADMVRQAKAAGVPVYEII